MGEWAPDQHQRTGSAEELEVAPANLDGTLRPHTTIWVVRVGPKAAPEAVGATLCLVAARHRESRTSSPSSTNGPARTGRPVSKRAPVD
jgi:hypothetical protein